MGKVPHSTRLLTSASSTFRLPMPHLPAAQLTFPHFFPSFFCTLPQTVHTLKHTPILETASFRLQHADKGLRIVGLWKRNGAKTQI